ncbi:MAG: exo-alpha-sialidase [Oscillospiraceae bacterium]|nr:exo-alpha-sialidase [Oscillospiraceae bacterium]
MLITDKNELQKFGSSYRMWQGIPGIEVTSGGRIYSTFYSGGVKEELNNFVVLLRSDDGKEFGEPIAAAFKENYRCFDSCLWIDPLGRLWFTWSCAPDIAVYGVVCDNPDADELSWSEVFKIGKDVMMNKPCVLSSGEWLFPISVWPSYLSTVEGRAPEEDSDRRPFAYKSIDNGKSFVKLGGAEIDKRSADEHKIIELLDGRLAMFIRTTYGIGVSYSFDRGKTWTKGEDSKLGGPCSRFFITRLKSGRILLVNHFNFTGRSHLTAMLSEDECKTWKYKLLIDERTNVSYPDAKEADDGYIYITYDRERGNYLDSMDKVYASAREILYAKITEEDIISGKLVNPNSRLKCIISKLGKYAYEDKNPFEEAKRFSVGELTERLFDKSNGEVVSFIFDHYQINCINMQMLDVTKLDELIEHLDSDGADRKKTIHSIIELVRSVTDSDKNEAPVVDEIKRIAEENISEDISVGDMAKIIGISMHYMCHLFKKTTGITIGDYKKELKITYAKKLLVNTDKKISEITGLCGFGSDSYFSKIFKEAEGVSPSAYRELKRI